MYTPGFPPPPQGVAPYPQGTSGETYYGAPPPQPMAGPYPQHHPHGAAAAAPGAFYTGAMHGPQMHAGGGGYSPSSEAMGHRLHPAEAVQGGAGGGDPKLPGSAAMLPPGSDIEAQTYAAFADKAVRNGFVRKVFAILTIQLAITVGFSLMCLYVDPVRTYVRSSRWLFYLAIGLALALVVTLSCSENLRRRYPTNMYLLTAFTLTMAFLVGMITSFFDIEVVVMAFITTAAAVAIITLVATQSKFDVTSKGSYLMIALMVLLVTTIIGVFWVSRTLYLLIAGFGALLFSFFLLYDIQLVMGGRKYSISPDEYVFAALTIYLDIVNIFMFLLQIFSLTRNS